MRWRWGLVVCVLISGCDAGAPEPPKSSQSDTPVPWTGPLPPHELVTPELPSAREVVELLGKAYANRKPLKATALHSERSDFVDWTFTYDGIDIDQQAITSMNPRGAGFITRIHPTLQAPARLRRADLIGDATALARAGRSPNATLRLRYKSRLEQREVTRPGSNAMDYVMVVNGYTLVYWIKDAHGSIEIDAYTGDVVDRAPAAPT